MTFIRGIRYPEQISAFMDTLQRASFLTPNSCSISHSRPNALIRDSPETLSSTCPFSAPRFFCCSLKSFLVCFVTVLVNKKISPTPARATMVKSGFRHTIITKMPIIVKP